MLFILIYSDLFLFFYMNVHLFQFHSLKTQLNNCTDWILWRYINTNDYSRCADTRVDSKLLDQALLLARDILNSVDRQVDAREKEHELIEIYNKLDARSSALYKVNKFKVSRSKAQLVIAELFRESSVI